MTGQQLNNALLRQSPTSVPPGQPPIQQALSTGQEIVIGREPQCQIVLDSTLYSSVSRRHASLQSVQHTGSSSWQICDLNSANGTYVNGQRLQGCQPLRSGDRILIGQNGPEFMFEQQFAAPPSPAPGYSPHVYAPTEVSAPAPEVAPPVNYPPVNAYAEPNAGYYNAQSSSGSTSTSKSKTPFIVGGLIAAGLLGLLVVPRLLSTAKNDPAPSTPSPVVNASPVPTTTPSQSTTPAAPTTSSLTIQDTSWAIEDASGNVTRAPSSTFQKGDDIRLVLLDVGRFSPGLDGKHRIEMDFALLDSSGSTLGTQQNLLGESGNIALENDTAPSLYASFQTDDVPPGSYAMRITVYDKIGGGTVNHTGSFSIQ